MKRIILHKGRTLALLCIGILASGPVLAERPPWADGGHEDRQGNDGWRSGNDSNNGGSYNNTNYDDRDHDGNGYNDDRNYDGYRDHHESNSSVYFDDQRRNSVRDYYSREIHSGHCPPGLAKKHNGCMPPGLAKRWAIGHRLPRDVIFYDLQPQILAYLGPPPPRHRYVRVASDILLIALGTGMVLDAIEDLGRY